ncbi:MAG: N-acetyltransferase [Deltaproteobacteria bacterium]|nr:N-acetyltransferase [Deltaproteobacteria bacterium]
MDKTANKPGRAFKVSPMAKSHGKDVIRIFNHYVMHSDAAYLEEPVSRAFFDRFSDMAQGYPAFCAHTQQGEFAGFAFLRAHQYLPAFARTAVATCFLAPEHTRRGLGTLLYGMLFEQAVEKGVATVLANIHSANEASIRFHQKMGFAECGRFREIGVKSGRVFDVVWMQKFL